MLEDNENVVVETTENVEEQATEKLVDGAKVAETTENVEEKLYSEAELNERVNQLLADKIGGKLAQQERRLRRDNAKEIEKYKRLETILKTGLNASGSKVETIDEIVDIYDNHFKSRGVKIPDQPTYSEYDLRVLSNAEANEIINSGYEEVVEEVDRLAEIGVDNMSTREKLVFQALAKERMKQESIKELAQIGVKPEALNDSEYQDFASKLNPSLSEKDKYEMFMKFKPKPKVEPMGSMKTVPKKEVKDHYSPEEISRMTLDDLNDPILWEAVRKSMTGQN